jgi:site-specific recombinase XerD
MAFFETLIGDPVTTAGNHRCMLPYGGRVPSGRALREWQGDQAAEREAAGSRWQDTGTVFTTATGTPLGARHIRKMFQDVCQRAGLGRDWAPRDLRHTFVSLLSDDGMAIEKIARLAGHASSHVTETVYRQELRPVLQEGAEVMDRLFGTVSSGLAEKR